MWGFLGEFEQLLICLALLPTGSVRSEHEIIRRVSTRYAAAGTPDMLQRKTTRLIEVFQDAGVVLKFENKSEFRGGFRTG